ncbi:uncharacterized protein LOC125836839 [Solanum verrucosum]|uniref:uncharacterized protein LOC125836839 n=1 Tax=Solanum verrucosum TaxID=315347 RepID=UPI0020CFFD5D|nr:uncharacterized protein LOC125836839 [Solanum verrucosum]
MAIPAYTTVTSDSAPSMAVFPIIDHNHPLFLQHTDTPVLHDQWEKCNVVGLSWIMNAVRPGLLSSVVYASNAHKVWLDLREKFDTVNGSRIFHLHREIHTLSQGTMSVADYFSKLRDLWDEYDALMPCPSCPCPESRKFGEHCPTYTHGYGSFKGSSSMTSGGPNGGASTSGSYKGRRPLLQCDHCGCKGHSKDQCYKIVGCPADFKSKRKGKSSRSFANQVEPSQSLEPRVHSTTVQQPRALFTQDQYQQILQLLSRSGDETTVTPPARVAYADAVDTGATHHITSHLNTLATSTEAPANSDSRVNLPNGNTVSVSHIGFFPNFCILRDLSTGQVKGIGLEYHVLYILRGGSHQGPHQAPKKLVNNSSSSPASDNGSKCLLESMSNSLSKSKSADVWHKRHVVFHEHSYPFKDLQASSNPIFPVLEAVLTYADTLGEPSVLKAYSAICEPASFHEAASDPAWVKAMALEIAALEKRYKARLVAKGFSQKEGIDFGEIFSHVAKMVTVRSVVALAASRGWYIYQIDVHNAFLNGDLLDEVYMTIPSVIVLVYVDDPLVTGSNQKLLCDTSQEIQKKFKMKDLGELKFFLGIQFSRSNKGILMSQRKYASDLISESGLGGAKPACTPLEMNQKLTSVQYDEHINNGIPEGDTILTYTTKYQRVVGKLLSLTMTTPDLAFSIQVLSQFMHCPKKSHMEEALRVVRYIKEALDLGLLMSAKDTSKLIAYCDSDWEHV